MIDKRFNPKKLEKLNNPNRFKALAPEFIVEKAAIDNPKVIIDLGAGTGFYAIPFSEIYKQATLYACDISDIMVDWMDDNIASKYDNIIPTLMGDNHVPLDNDIADFLFMINLHHELDKPTETLKECYRLLKANAKIAISDWKKEEMEQGPSIDIRYYASEIEEQLLAVGFKNVCIYSELAYNYLIIAEKI